MRMITATEANRDFSKLLEEVSDGETVAITKHGKIVASISPAAKTATTMEEAKRELLSLLQTRRRYTVVKERGSRDELYDD